MQSIAQTLRNLGTVRLVAMGGVAMGIVIFFVFLSARLNTADMSLLYADLDTGDSAKIISKLETLGVPFDLRADGRQILVPSDRVLRLRMSMAEEGLPNGGSIGYEIFDKSESFGTTNFVQNVNLVRALEGELARTVRTMGQVTEARVHLVLPKRQLFSRKRQEPSASIVIKTRGPKKLDKVQVLSIQHLVASAVPELKISRISVIDHRGRLLARAGSPDERGIVGASDNDEVQRDQEERMVRAIEELLEQSVGIGRVRAQVTAQMNFDRITTNSETYDPEGQVVRSTQNVEEKANSLDQRSGAGVTVSNNLPDAKDSKAQNKDNTTNQSSRVEETVNFEISKTVKSHVREMGIVKRLSIAVLVDGTYSIDKDDKRIYKPRSKKELNDLSTLVRSAVGVNEKRGDTLRVVNMRFVNAAENDIDTLEPLFGLTKSDYFRIAEIFVLAAVGILVILLVVRPLISRTLEALPNALAAATEQNLLADQSADSAALSGPAETGVSSLPGEGEEDDLIDVASVDGKVRASALKKIEEIVERHPEETVGIIRHWMSEDS
ncbi:MAG: flagellar M-ring protein FliF [Alphaproteobacteria bacterium]|nr:flagellar M-ring protein FliF [Alphaproteobacteria bacterium]